MLCLGVSLPPFPPLDAYFVAVFCGLLWMLNNKKCYVENCSGPQFHFSHLDFLTYIAFWMSCILLLSLLWVVCLFFVCVCGEGAVERVITGFEEWEAIPSENRTMCVIARVWSKSECSHAFHLKHLHTDFTHIFYIALHIYTYSPSHASQQCFFVEHTHTGAQWAAICSHQSSCLGSPSGLGHHQWLSLSFSISLTCSHNHVEANKARGPSKKNTSFYF